MTATKLKAILTLVGSALVTASVYLPHPWALVAATMGGLFGGSALIRRPGDEKAAP